MTFVALFAALTAACAVFPQIQAPLIPAPIVVQNIGVIVAGSILGARRGCLALALFVLLVAVGMPILTGWRGGFGVILGPTGGFILSWIPAAFVIGWLVEKSWNSLGFRGLLAFNADGGIFAVCAPGVPRLAVVANMDLGEAVTGSVLFVPGDLVKAVLATFAALVVKRACPLIRGWRRKRPAAFPGGGAETPAARLLRSGAENLFTRRAPDAAYDRASGCHRPETAWRLRCARTATRYLSTN